MAQNNKENKDSIENGESKQSGGLFSKKEYKKTVSGKERYEQLLEKERQKELEREGLAESAAEPEAQEESNPKSGRARYLAMLEKERKRIEEFESYNEEKSSKPSVYDALKSEAADGEKNAEASSEDEGNTDEPTKSKVAKAESASDKTDEDMLRRAFLRRFLCSVALALAAIGLQFAHFHVPLTPSIFAIDFSSLPELLASIAYGPIAGIAIIIVKNVIYMLIRHVAYVSAISNILLDSLFVTIAGLLYSKGVSTRKKSKTNEIGMRKINSKRRKSIFLSGLISSAITSVAGYFVTTFITFRFLFRRTPTVDNEGRLVDMYQQSLNAVISHFPFVSKFVTEIHSVAQGTLLFYLDVTFAKLIIVTIAVAIIYPLISDFLHYRK